MRPTQVMADHRESKSGVGEYLSALPGVRLQWENLRTGDYIAGHQFARLRGDTPRYRKYKAKRRWTQQLHLLATLPTVGPDRAYRLLDHFGSVEACITATAEELEQVPGIGPKTAATIRSLVTAQADQPLNGPQKRI